MNITNVNIADEKGNILGYISEFHLDVNINEIPIKVWWLRYEKKTEDSVEKDLNTGKLVKTYHEGILLEIKKEDIKTTFIIKENI